jgi:phosphoribosyl 1,2-cyclic phosphate phosphodiesterase
LTITFLGTGTSQGIPVIACECAISRTALHITTDDGLSLVFDTGPDFRTQMLRERVKKLDAVLFTHEHKDHTAGLDDVRSFNFKQKKDMPVYARLQVIEQLKREFSYVFAEKKYPGVPQIQINEINNNPFLIGETEITPIEVMHYKLPVYGFRIKDFTYITDANYIAPDELEKIKGTKVLVLNALQKEAHISHFTLDEAVEIVNLIQPEKAYFTHMSHKLGKHRDIDAELPDNMQLAFDGLKLHL